MQRAEETKAKNKQVQMAPSSILLALLLAGLTTAGLGLPARTLAALRKVHFRCNFKPADRSEWEFPRAEDWAIQSEGGVHYLHMLRPGDPGTPRRPLQFALLKNVNVGSFDLRVKVRRQEHSLIIVFNYVDTLHFYYTHISGDQNVSNHNGIFIVNGEPRKQVAGFGVRPALPDTNWHTIRVVRNVHTGSIQVFSDVQKAALFTYTDKHFQCGRIGLGSFDETGDFTDVDLRSSEGDCAPGVGASAKMLLRQPQFQP